VVVGAERARQAPRRLSDYTFAVRDEVSGRFVTIGKAYTGLTDAEIATMTRWFEAHTVRQLVPLSPGRADGRGRRPFDVITLHAGHQSGFALRFPRIVRLRLDRAADEIRHAPDGRATATESRPGPDTGHRRTRKTGR